VIRVSEGANALSETIIMPLSLWFMLILFLSFQQFKPTLSPLNGALFGMV
jgi:hypothetical protein